ncbi:MAG: hypothetical protein QOF98_1643, partial [Streptomyces sp.]|nr:hypothetical protein [Streptomyces sp.]
MGLGAAVDGWAGVEVGAGAGVRETGGRGTGTGVWLL